MSDFKFEQLQGKIAFLNGQEGLDDRDEDLFDALTALGKECILIDNLFDDHSGLMKLVGVDTLALSTTGIFAEKLNTLVDVFEKLNISFKNVVFGSENTALFFCELAREMKKEHGTKFFFADATFDNEFNEINWI